MRESNSELFEIYRLQSTPPTVQLGHANGHTCSRVNAFWADTLWAWAIAYVEPFQVGQ